MVIAITGGIVCAVMYVLPKIIPFYYHRLPFSTEAFLRTLEILVLPLLISNLIWLTVWLIKRKRIEPKIKSDPYRDFLEEEMNREYTRGGVPYVDLTEVLNAKTLEEVDAAIKRSKQQARVPYVDLSEVLNAKTTKDVDAAFERTNERKAKGDSQYIDLTEVLDVAEVLNAQVTSYDAATYKSLRAMQLKKLA